ncbi:unnamed protein product, partial [Didymodactylos carnosus]
MNGNDRCIDWRDICDNEQDCRDGEDERNCEKIEMNGCTIEHDFRCRNGLCISKGFLFDMGRECLDGTDEQRVTDFLPSYHPIDDKYKDCFLAFSIDCDERTCGKEKFSCGDGQCIAWNERFSNETLCNNYQDAFHMCELKKNMRAMKTGQCDWKIENFIGENDTCHEAVVRSRTTDYSNDNGSLIMSLFKHVRDKCSNSGVFYKYFESYSFTPFIEPYLEASQFAYYNYEIAHLVLHQSTRPAQFCVAGYKQTNCSHYINIYEQNYPFPPFEYLFGNVIKKHLISSFYCNNTSFYLCRTSHECISKYRLFDGFYDCIDRSDERNYSLISSLDKKYLRDRYQCETTPGLVLPHFLGDKEKQCEDGSDEMSSVVNWQIIFCDEVQQHCRLIRQSWAQRSNRLAIDFHGICNSHWDVRNGLDEINCTDWVCGTSSQIKYKRDDVELWNGNCVWPPKRCDGIWNFIDGRDELNCDAEHSAYKIKLPPCRNITTKEIIDINSKWRLRGDVHVDCIGGQDERNTYACQDGLSLNERFLCLNGTCIEQMYTCDGFKHCLEGEDEDLYLCTNRSASLCPPGTCECNPDHPFLMECISNTKRCDNIVNCRNTMEDERFCYRATPVEDDIIIPETKSASENKFAWYCDRGVLILRRNQLACLCPPSYFGNRCQYHNHRLTVAVVLDASTVTDFTRRAKISLFPIVRLLVLLEYKNRTIDHFIITQLAKATPTHRFYLNYPWILLEHIHFDQNSQFKIKFLLYNIDIDYVKLLFFWEYDVEYPFLPAYRLAKILHVDLRERRRLLRQVCSGQCLHGTCYPILNKENDYYCDCEIEWNGKNCDEAVLWKLSNDTLTNVSSTCANSSIYLPTFYDYNASKYTSFMCICPVNTWGATCNLKIPNQCSTSIFKCDNNGICLRYKDNFYEDWTICQCPGNSYALNCKAPTSVVTIHKNEKFSNLPSTIFTAIVQVADIEVPLHSFVTYQSKLIIDDNSPITYELYDNENGITLQAGFFKLYEEDNDGNHKSNIYLLYFIK